MNSIVRNLAKSSHFNYDQQGKDWKVKGGNFQSPITLAKDTAVKTKAPEISFLNYNKTLSGPLEITNNGHTVTMPIPVTDDGTQPAVCGFNLECLYKAVQLHFHWGSAESKGSEHTLDSSRYDAELHILHRNSCYAEDEEALCFPDGFVVLAILLSLVSNPKVNTRVLNKVCNEVNLVKDFNKTTTFEGEFTLRDILVGIERQEFFAYRGSLTTPPCSESVNWFVFPKPVDVSKESLQNFWLVKDADGRPLINNYRELQCLHDRTVYYRNQNKRKRS